jgi:hypothetical protein
MTSTKQSTIYTNTDKPIMYHFISYLQGCVQGLYILMSKNLMALPEGAYFLTS